MFENERAYIHTDKLLDGNSWYDADRTARICQKYVELVTARGRLKAAVTNAEEMKLNKEIKTEIYHLTEFGCVQDDIALKDEVFRRLKAVIEKNAGVNKSAYTVEFIQDWQRETAGRRTDR